MLNYLLFLFSKNYVVSLVVCNKTFFFLVPTFIIFLSDIESGSEVNDYCKVYLGDSHSTQQFASTFLEKRRSFKPKNNAHKDDMCSPAPAITPSVQHNNEFQEVKVNLFS